MKKYTADELENLPTLYIVNNNNCLKIDNGTYRVWLSKYPGCRDEITIEKILDDEWWEVIDRYVD